ncbi:MAG: dienelactone hydrolase family protein [Ginsengibacter sp.]
MMNKKLLNPLILLITILSFSCNNSGKNNKPAKTMAAMNIHEESVTYSLNGKEYKALFAYDENRKGIRPAIIVVPEWWGLNDYAKSRAKQLAELGYAAMAIDVYGGGKIAADPKEAQELTTPFYKDPTLAKPIIDAAINKIKMMPHADPSNIAAIGYCFGGGLVLNAAKLGANLKGVVSFHGSLKGVTPNKDLIKAKILVCHGAADQFENPNVAQFKKEMDSAHIDYIFKEYAGATHAFTNPDATEVGKKFNMPVEYNAAADKASWNDMKDFFKNIFGK